MYLMVDTSERDVVVLSVFDEMTRQKVVKNVSNRDLLKCIDEFLNTQKLRKEDVSGIMVVVGEGSFTSTRLATTVVNTFAYVQDVPVLAISKEQAVDPQALIPELLKQLKGQYISATYSGVPNIGKKN